MTQGNALTLQYRWGSMSRYAGQDATENPFTPLSDSWLEWADGWKDADHYRSGTIITSKEKSLEHNNTTDTGTCAY